MGSDFQMNSERDLIAEITALASAGPPPEVLRGIGDDCAVLRKDPETVWLVTTDMLVEGIHFEPAWHSALLVGRKAASVNVSDIAAMGGTARYVLLSLSLPGGGTGVDCRRLLQGFDAVLREQRIALVGGDTVRSRQGTVISVTMIGEAPASVVRYRDGAEPGDLVWVTGRLGEAACGLEICRRYGLRHDDRWRNLIKAHLDPAPPVRLGPLLAGGGMAHAMMDLSDGLATDLAHICQASGTAAEIYGDALPVSEELIEAAGILGLEPFELALTGGEDYQLLFTAPETPGLPAKLTALAGAAAGVGVHCVGRIIRGGGVYFCPESERPGRGRREISYRGYDHFADP